jgi:hypothetical protein
MADINIKRKQKIQVVMKNKWKILIEILVVLFSLGIFVEGLLFLQEQFQPLERIFLP